MRSTNTAVIMAAGTDQEMSQPMARAAAVASSAPAVRAHSQQRRLAPG